MSVDEGASAALAAGPRGWAFPDEHIVLGSAGACAVAACRPNRLLVANPLLPALITRLRAPTGLAGIRTVGQRRWGAGWRTQ